MLFRSSCSPVVPHSVYPLPASFALWLLLGNGGCLGVSLSVAVVSSIFTVDRCVLLGRASFPLSALPPPFHVWLDHVVGSLSLSQLLFFGMLNF